MTATLEERLKAHLRITPSGCHEWTYTTDDKGYGRIWVDGRMAPTHRVAWTLANGPIPTGLCVLHHCDNPPCCNAEKCLFLGTQADNMADMAAKGRWGSGMGLHNLAKTHCPARHAYDEANTYVDQRGRRNCRICRRAAVARYAARVKAGTS